MPELLAVGATAVLLTLAAYPDTAEAGVVGLWEGFVNFWRYAAQLYRSGR